MAGTEKSQELTLPSFDDESAWEIKRAVPIFDEGAPIEYRYENTETGGTRRIPVKFATKKDLEEIIENCRRREIETGDPIQINLGHTLDNVPEASQPPTLGWGRNPRLGSFGAKGKLAILTDNYYYPDRYRKFELDKDHRRRSVEFWRKSKHIDVIAHKTGAPERDLGVLVYEKKFDRIIYAIEEEDSVTATTPPAVPVDEIVQKVMAGLEASPVWKYAKEQAEKAKPPAPPVAPPVVAPPATDPAEVLRMQREEQAIRFARVESENQTLRTEFQGMVLRLQRTDREKQLIQLEAEGYEFSRDKELTRGDKMDAAGWGEHLTAIREHYKKAPVGSLIRLSRDHVEGGKEESKLKNEADVDACLRYQKEHKIEDWEAAMAAYLKSKAS